MRVKYNLMSLWQFELRTTQKLAEALSERLQEEILSLSIFKDEHDPEIWILQGFTSEEHFKNNLSILLQEEVSRLSVTLPSFIFERVPTKNWVAENQHSFPPLEIGNFYIYGSHIEQPQWGSKFPLKIDASTAFGTGHHGTTEGCLLALTDLKNQGFSFKNPLDLGCGTGILALAIAKLFDTSVLASDLDPEAVEKTVFNSQENQESPRVSVYCAAGLDHSIIKESQPFDLIIANILAGPLLTLAPDIINALAPKGILILSGLLKEQAGIIEKAYNPPLILKESYPKGEWITLTFQHPKYKSL